jgi:hypothetical protein
MTEHAVARLNDALTHLLPDAMRGNQSERMNCPTNGHAFCKHVEGNDVNRYAKYARLYSYQLQ